MLIVTDKIRWGILGTGNIAHQFANGLKALTDAELIAVGSRSQESADKFANEFNVPNRHASYEALASDPQVDAIYISTPHPFHKENTLLCLQAGKAVLCEKPFALNVHEGEEMIEMARSRGVFLMEAMWTRFLPALIKVRELIAKGTIGEPRMLTADFGFRTSVNPQGRLFDPKLGGALLDVGVYPVSLASMLFGAPEHIVSLADIGSTGIDEQSAMIFKYGQGQLALLSSAVRTNTPQEAVISGTLGQIRLHSQWWRCSHLTLSVGGKRDRGFRLPYEGNGYNYEAAEVGRCLRAGEKESPVMPHAETLSILKTMDHIRAQWNLKYPSEK
jgi:predicted dehydrogenase